MKTPIFDHVLPQYQGQKWFPVTLPTQAQNWVAGNKHALRNRRSGCEKTREAVRRVAYHAKWKWPSREIIFISDLHADAQALRGSLLASGGVKLTGFRDKDFELTKKGKKALFIFGGDFFDKGPSNLKLMHQLNLLIQKGARVRLLAGNHDIRTLFGMRCAGQADNVKSGHFFIRMGKKAIPFLKEINEAYLLSPDAMKDIPSEDVCKTKLFPSQQWWDEFPTHAKDVMTPAAIERELAKIKEKMEQFEGHCRDAGMTLREVYAAALKWQCLFLSPTGEFNWFFKKMRIILKRGTFVFLHAGLDDQMAKMLDEKGSRTLNKIFTSQLNGSPFDFYYGPIANTIRTKYRTTDMQLSLKGASHAKKAGIYAVVHGHRNLLRGQRISLRKGMLNFECDVTLDQGSRAKEGLKGVGCGATLITPNGYVIGVSNDASVVRVFYPKGESKLHQLNFKDDEKKHHKKQKIVRKLKRKHEISKNKRREA